MTQDTVTLEVVILFAILLEQNVSQPLFLTDNTMRIWYLLNWSVNFPPFMEPEVQRHVQKKAAIGPFPEPVEFGPCPHTLFL